MSENHILKRKTQQIIPKTKQCALFFLRTQTGLFQSLWKPEMSRSLEPGEMLSRIVWSLADHYDVFMLSSRINSCSEILCTVKKNSSFKLLCYFCYSFTKKRVSKTFITKGKSWNNEALCSHRTDFKTAATCKFLMFHVISQLFVLYIRETRLQQKQSRSETFLLKTTFCLIITKVASYLCSCSQTVTGIFRTNCT